MWCLVRRPDAVVEEVVVAPKAIGQKCLDEVCQRLGIIETDYFGLRYTGKKGERLWLNLRNSIRDQVPNFPPYRMELRVKFFVNPRHILQKETRRQFYLQLKSELLEGNFDLNRRQIIILSALIAQVEFGDHTDGQIRYPAYAPDWTCELNQAVAAYHDRLQGMDADTATLNFLLEMNQLEKYGMETHAAWSCDTDREPVEIGIKENTVKIFDRNRKIVIHSYDFDDIKQTKCQGKHFAVVVATETATSAGQKTTRKKCFQMQSKTAAMAVHRSLTEMRVFHRRTTVDKWIKQSGYHGNFLESVASLFRPRSSSLTGAKHFRYDVIRTQNEVIDKIKRELGIDTADSTSESQSRGTGNLRQRRSSDSFRAGFHEPTRRQLRQMRLRQSETSISEINGNGDLQYRGRSMSAGNLLQTFENEGELNYSSHEVAVRKWTSTGDLLDCDVDFVNYTPPTDRQNKKSTSFVLRRKLQDIEESLTCKICMDARMNTAFCPCGHMVCCRQCASQCSECPVCRTEIRWLQTIFMQ
ncbi:E3 ubiquitin-protein ligase MYLIP-like [Ptychodera flava]|uniref:E3 ubiquitin-protein ligase MYLIP-like n=1 Tax=Ptychodera flava TaxID=63121 RepID=UPI003969CBF1